MVASRPNRHDGYNRGQQRVNSQANKKGYTPAGISTEKSLHIAGKETNGGLTGEVAYSKSYFSFRKAISRVAVGSITCIFRI